MVIGDLLCRPVHGLADRPEESFENQTKDPQFEAMHLPRMNEFQFVVVHKVEITKGLGFRV
jgi:hypothetical protein